MFRSGDKGAAKEVAESIREFALVSPEMGMYWKNPGGYNWYAAPIESHALLMEVFFEILKDEESVELMLTWLLKQKQTTDWRTTKATVEACYALLMRGVDRLNESRPPRITLGKTNPVVVEPGKTNTTKPTAQITTSKSNAPATGFQGAPPRGVGLTPPFGGARGQRPLPPEAKTEAGSGYFKTAWQGEAVKPGMGLVTVENKNNVTAWGSLYWQYFEDLDKITPAKTPLEIKRELFVEKTIESSLILHPIKEGTPVAVGETVKVRIVLRVDRDMEYVHLKDMRASNLEPEHVLSGYEYSNGIGYYRVTKDASTNFFFDYLPKGVYVFEYLLRVTHRGDFSNGISSAQCMYAPEFTAHSRGIRLKTQGK
ncbi:MAG: hypothetical protein GY765_12610, partial [bacterium]|nr:hypothetical protein [bacterium]